MKTNPCPTEEAVIHSRTVEQLVAGKATSDGSGVKLIRVLTQSLQSRLDPFLLLDAFGSDNPADYIGGFPAHPHRGFETATYMIAGRMRHRDSAGHEGLLENGGMQWMTAGRGVIHAEMPEQKEGVMEGFQLWLNLPSQDKMMTPWYRDFPAAELPGFVTPAGVRVTVLAGQSHGVAGAITRDITQPIYLDIHLPADRRFTQPLPAGHNSFVYVYRGKASIAGTQIPTQRMAILANGAHADGVVIEAAEDARVLLIAGRPLNEPILQYGPIVMNTQQEIKQAMDDLRHGRLAAETI